MGTDHCLKVGVVAHSQLESTLIDSFTIADATVNFCKLEVVTNGCEYSIQLFDMNIPVLSGCDAGIQFRDYENARDLFEMCRKDLLLRVVCPEPRIRLEDYFTVMWEAVKKERANA